MEERGGLEAVEVHVLESIHVVIFTRGSFLGGDLDRLLVILPLIFLRFVTSRRVKGAHRAAAAARGDARGAAASLWGG